MSTESRVAFVRYNMPLGGSVADTYKITPFVPVTAAVHSVEQFDVQDSTIGPVGQSFTVGDISANKSVTLTRDNSFSKDLRIRFTHNDSLLRSFQGMPASKCAGYVNELKYQSTLITSAKVNNPDYTVSLTLAPGFWNGTPISINPQTTQFSNPSQHTDLQLTNGRANYFQTGSDILASTYGATTSEGPQYPGFSDFDPEYFYANIFITTSKAGSAPYSITFDVNCLPVVTNSNSTLIWYGKTYIFDGLDSDTIAPMISRFNIVTDIDTIYDSNLLIQSRSFLTEISQSVITGVEKTLQSNATLSVTAQVEHRATATIIQQTELSATTFNFRFMEPLVIQSQNTTTAAGSIKRNLAAPLSLSSESTASFAGNLIFDLIKEYRWDDFNIVGYFISGYSTAGYAADSADYGWDELSTDPWDAWTYSVWGGIEAAWDIWPDDVWNSTKTLTSVFSSSEIGHIIRSGVGQLLSSTALTDNSAFLITGASTVRSDFLCDGSPTGLMGGGSTIVSDAVLTGLANYIINNPHTISGAFTPTLLGNYIATFLFQAQSNFSLTVNPRFKPSGVTNAQCISMVDALANAIYGPTKTMQSAFDPVLVARMFIGTDPYLIHKILQETRQIFVDAESRGIQIAEEIRLNSIPAENRAFLVPQETRKMKLRIPPMTNRFTTPKVRTE